MKRKLTSILLALALCLPLSTSTVASEAEELPAPKIVRVLDISVSDPEWTEVETEDGAICRVTDVSGGRLSDGVPADESLTAKELADLRERVGEFEPGKWYVQERKFFSLPPTTNDELKALIADLIEREGELDPEKTYVLKTEYVHLNFDDLCQEPVEADTVLYGIAAAQAEEGPCPDCGKDNWGPRVDRDSGLVNVNDVIHGESYSTVYICKKMSCGCVRTTYKLKQVIPHSWSVSSLSFSDSDSDHVATCTYTCECGATKDVPLTAEALADLLEREGELEPGKTYVLGRQYGHLHFETTTDDEFKALFADLLEREGGELEPGKAYVLKTEYGHLDFNDQCQYSAEEAPALPDVSEEDGPIWVWGNSDEIDAVCEWTVNGNTTDGHDHHFKGKLSRIWYEEEGNQYRMWAEYAANCTYECGAYATLCEPVGDDVPLTEDTEAPVSGDISKTTRWTWVTPSTRK